VLGNMRQMTIAWGDTDQPQFASARDSWSASQQDELAILWALREGANPWELDGKESVRPFFLALAHGFITAARAMLALPQAPPLLQISTKNYWYVKRKTNDDRHSLLGLFVSANRTDAVGALIEWGWQEPPSENKLPWVAALFEAPSGAMLRCLASSPRVTPGALIHFLSFLSGIGGFLGRIGESPESKAMPRLKDAIEALVEQRGPNARSDPAFRAILLQAQALGGFCCSMALGLPPGWNAEDLWDDPEVLAQPVVAQQEYSGPLGHWLAVASFWIGRPTKRGGYTSSNHEMCVQAHHAGLRWVRENSPDVADQIETACEAVTSPQGKTDQEMIPAARWTWEGMQALGVFSGYISATSIREAQEDLWERFPDPPYLSPAAQESQRWLVRAGNLNYKVMGGWVQEKDSPAWALEHFAQLSLQLISLKRDDPKFLTSNELSEWVAFWYLAVRHVAFKDVKMSPQDVATVVEVLHGMSSWTSDTWERENTLSRLRSKTLDHQLPAAAAAVSLPKPRF